MRRVPLRLRPGEHPVLLYRALADEYWSAIGIATPQASGFLTRRVLRGLGPVGLGRRWYRLRLPVELDALHDDEPTAVLEAEPEGGGRVKVITPSQLVVPLLGRVRG